MQNLNEKLIFSDEGKFGKFVTQPSQDSAECSDAQTGLRARVVAEERREQQQADLGETARVRRGEPGGERRPAVCH